MKRIGDFLLKSFSSPARVDPPGSAGGLTVKKIKAKTSASVAHVPLEYLDSVKDMVKGVTDYLVVAEQEQTKRSQIEADREVALTALRNQRANFQELLQHTFEERKLVLQKQFDALDQALADGNVAVVQAALSGMLSVIQTSPFRSMEEMQKALGSKDFVIRLE